MVVKSGREKFGKYKVIISFIERVLNILPSTFRKFLFIFCRNFNGAIGLGIRYILLRTLVKDCGENVSIQPGVHLFGFENLIIGNNVSIHPMCYIDASGGIEIGNNVSIAHGTTILSSTHTYQNMKVPIKYQEIIYKKTIILDNVWIGCKSTILYGLTVESGSIVGANSLVTKSVQKNSIVGGVPARIIKNRES